MGDQFGRLESLGHRRDSPATRRRHKSFVHKRQPDFDDLTIVGATIGLGKLLSRSVIVEGIEDGATADLLRSLGCDEGQGYYFVRPMLAAEFEQRFLSKNVLLNVDISVSEQATAAA